MRTARLAIIDVGADGPSALAGTFERVDAGWYTWRVGGAIANVCVLAGDGSGHFLAVLVSNDPAPVAAALAGSVIRSWASLSAFALDLSGIGIAAKRRWPWWRATGTYVDPATSAVVPFAWRMVKLTGPLATLTPSVGSPLVTDGYTITSLDAVAFGQTIAGWTDDQDAETGGP